MAPPPLCAEAPAVVSRRVFTLHPRAPASAASASNNSTLLLLSLAWPYNPVRLLVRLFSCPAVCFCTCFFLPRSKPTLSRSPETSPSPHTPPHCLPLAGCSLSLISAPNTSHPYYCLIYHQLYQSLLQPHPHPPHSTPPFTSTSTIPVSVRPHPVSPALNPASAPFETIAFVELANLPCLP
jgi:hypothetical protein